MEGWPFPGSWPVVYHSARWEASATVFGGPSLWWGLELPVVAMKARSPMLTVRKREGGGGRSQMMSLLDAKTTSTPLKIILLILVSAAHHRVADVIVPGRVAVSRSRQITVVGGGSVVKRAWGVVVPVLGLKQLLFSIPKT